jgi:hypothetical protein
MIYAAADFILRPLVLAFLLLTAAALGLAWHGTFSRSGGGHTAPRRMLGWDEDDRATVVTFRGAITAPAQETYVPQALPECAGPHPALDHHAPAAVTVTDDPPAGRHEAPRVHPFRPGDEPYCGKCGTAGHWRGSESCADRRIDETLIRRREDRVTAAMNADLKAAGLKVYDSEDDALKSIFTRAMAMSVRAIEAKP